MKPDSIEIRHLGVLWRRAGCSVLARASHASNDASDRFLDRRGFGIRGFHFIKPSGDWWGRGGI